MYLDAKHGQERCRLHCGASHPSHLGADNGISLKQDLELGEFALDVPEKLLRKEESDPKTVKQRGIYLLLRSYCCGGVVPHEATFNATPCQLET